MRYLVALVFAFSVITPITATDAKVSDFRVTVGSGQDVVEHGGGCRKSSPAGQCCHMDHKTGIVHCH